MNLFHLKPYKAEIKPLFYIERIYRTSHSKWTFYKTWCLQHNPRATEQARQHGPSV